MEQIVVHCLQVCEKLTELYLSHNSISEMEGLSTLQNLRVLDLASNRITVISKLERLTRCSLFLRQPMSRKSINYHFLLFVLVLANCR